MPHSTTISRAIATLAAYPSTPPLILHTPDTATHRALQTLRSHPYVQRNEGPVAVYRTPEGITAYRNPEHDGPPAPAHGTPADPATGKPATRLPARLQPLPHAELLQTFQQTTEPPPAPETARKEHARQQSEAHQRIQLLQSPPHRGRSGLITYSRGSAGHYRSLYPDGQFRYVSPGTDPEHPEGGVYCRFPANPGQPPPPAPEDTPDFIHEPPPARKAGRRNTSDQPGPETLLTPKEGCFHVFLRRDTPASAIPDFLTELAYRTGDLHRQRTRKVPFDALASPQDRYIPAPLPSGIYDAPHYEDRLIRLIATDAAYLVTDTPAAVYLLRRKAEDIRGRRIPTRPPRLS